MANLQVVPKEDLSVTPALMIPPTTLLIIQWVAGILLVFGLGTWLVWWGAYQQRHFALEDIRAACQRVMPETAERCVDTVIIQRGGARR
jgi:hypothetical protein